MNAPTDPALSLLTHHESEWHALKAKHYNVLIEGSVVETRAVLVRLEPLLRPPILWSSTQPSLQLPDADAGTLVLENVAALTEKDQTRLLEWQADAGRRVQIISTTEESLLPALAKGHFDNTLYYRLNVILLRLLATDELRLRDRDSQDARSQQPRPAETSPSESASVAHE
jgi:Sigma-54 interaction domain